jgi:putative membrane protein
LIGPFHELSEALFSAHMTQHEVIMLVSSPLIILGRSHIAAAWATPKNFKSYLVGITNNRTLSSVWRFVSSGPAALLIHAVALWVWHIPVLFNATLSSDFVHALQHMSFFGTAILFWWAIVNSSLDWRNSLVCVFYLFITSLQSGVLGAFLTFTRRAWYTPYLDTTAAWGLTPLEDQQLGGLIMWVPAGLVYIGAGLFMFMRLLESSEPRPAEHDRGILTSSVSHV